VKQVIMPLEQTIFQNASSTYYASAQNFPENIRDKVFRLYSFVRVADDYVDTVPQNIKAFQALRVSWDHAKNNSEFDTSPHQKDSINTRVIKNIVSLSRECRFEIGWVDAFLDAMQSDVQGRTLHTLDDSLEYVYGSGEVIGLMMARIMALPEASLKYARMQGRAMQWINFIRDIDEDNGLGRCYFPHEDLVKFNLSDLQAKTAETKPLNFKNFINFQLQRYAEWQNEAEKGFQYIPPKLLAPLHLAVSEYNKTAKRIETNPYTVFSSK